MIPPGLLALDVWRNGAVIFERNYLSVVFAVAFVV